MKPYQVQIFAGGDRIAANGMRKFFSTKELDEIVNTYNPKKFRAPAIITHDTQGYDDRDIQKSELCHGYPRQLQRVGQKIYAIYDHISADLARWIRDKQIIDRSASFYPPEHPHNPYPGKWSLRHVAFLGSTPPAVKGMEPLPVPNYAEFVPVAINFDFREQGIWNFSMNDATQNPWDINADMWQAMREWFIAQKGPEAADQIIPPDKIQDLRTCARNHQLWVSQMGDLAVKVGDLEQNHDDGDDDDDYNTDPSGGAAMQYKEEKSSTTKKPKVVDYRKLAKDAKMTAEDISEATDIPEDEIDDILQGEKPSPETAKKLDGLFNMAPEMRETMLKKSRTLKKQAADLAEKERIAKKQAADADKQQVRDFVENAIRQGKVASAERDRLVQRLLKADNEEIINYSEDRSCTARQDLMDDISARKAWSYKDKVVADEPTPTKRTEMDFSAPPGMAIDDEGMDHFSRAKTYCTKNNLDHMNSDHWARAVAATEGGR